jgi:hypothetical protein
MWKRMNGTATNQRQWRQRIPDFLPGRRAYDGLDVEAGGGREGSRRKNKMKSTYITLLMGLALSAVAQTSGRPQHQTHDPLHQPLLAAALDANKDGIIDAAERANAPAALSALDRNGNGQLEMNEGMPRLAHEKVQPASPPSHSRHPAPPAAGGGVPPAPAAPPHVLDEQGAVPAPPPPPPVPMLIAVLDANHDAVIDAAEIANAPAALKTLDKNGDGQLTPAEYNPGRQPHAGKGLRHERGAAAQREHGPAVRHSAPPAEE